MLEKPDNIFVVGKTGSGKTVKVNNLIKNRRRVVIVDTLGHDYNDGVIITSIPQLKRFWVSVYRGLFRIIYRPTNDVPEFEQICELAFMCGRLTMVVEELGNYTQANKIPLPFMQLLRQGRHFDIRTVCVSQRPVNINPLIRGMATDAYIFRTDEPLDVKYLRDRFGANVSDMLPQLKEYEYIYWSQRCSDLIVGKDPYP